MRRMDRSSHLFQLRGTCSFPSYLWSSNFYLEALSVIFAVLFSKVHYPFENKKEFEDAFPADFIAEGTDQTRFVRKYDLLCTPAWRHAFNPIAILPTVILFLRLPKLFSPPFFSTPLLLLSFVLYVKCYLKFLSSAAEE